MKDQDYIPNMEGLPDDLSEAVQEVINRAGWKRELSDVGNITRSFSTRWLPMNIEAFVRLKMQEAIEAHDRDSWITLAEDNLPPYSTQILVIRPNEYSKKNDVLMAYLHKAKPEGQAYGKYGCNRTFRPYWSFPALAPLEDVIKWRHLPFYENTNPSF